MVTFMESAREVYGKKAPYVIGTLIVVAVFEAALVGYIVVRAIEDFL